MKLGDLMNPEQYALEVLDMFLHKQCDLERTKFAYEENEVWNAVKMARDALEKRIPKKTKRDGNLHACPACYVLLLRRRKYCEECGQALDWRKEE